MAKLYSNENFPLPAVVELRRLGHDVLTVSEAGKAEQAIPDDEVLAFATERERAVLTINRKHFIALHRTSPHHAGIIVCTFAPLHLCTFAPLHLCTLDADFIGQVKRIDAALKESAELQGQLIRVNRPQQ